MATTREKISEPNVARHGVKPLPMWFHALDAMEANVVTVDQAQLGWTNAERLRIMGYYYKHRGQPRPAAEKVAR